jgi:hypothetical protein
MILQLLLDHSILTTLATILDSLDVLQSVKHCKVKAVKEIHERKGMLEMKVQKLKRMNNK